MQSKKQLRKILYVGMRYDYGRPEQGTSFEYNNFYRTLIRMVPSVVEFDFMTLMQREGKERMNRLLVETAARENPDLIFCILFTNEIDLKTIDQLSAQWITFNWFCDDHWRFDTFSKHVAPHFHFVSTTDHDALEKYHKHGYSAVFQTQWACNHYDYRKYDDAVKTFDVSFVGQPHGTRKRTISSLQNHGITVESFGRGWNNGRITQTQMIRIFNGTKINLNLSNSSWNIRTIFRNQQQIKGRNFEVPGCGSFLLTNYVEGLEQYYDLENEIRCFSSPRNLRDQILYFLQHEDEREQIALNGYQRTLREHTYEHRFIDLFHNMGFHL
jgi:spore maturation protein CgeB